MQDMLQAVPGFLWLMLLLASVATWGTIVSRLKLRRELVPFEPRAPKPFTGFDVLVLCIAYLFVEIAAAQLIVQLAGAEERLSTAALTIVIASRTAWVGLVVLYLSRRPGSWRASLGVDTTRLGDDIVLGVMTFLAAAGPVFAIQAMMVFLSGKTSQNPILQLTQDRPAPLLLLLATLTAVAIAPVVEEILFRVLLQGWLEKQQTVWESRHDAPPSESRESSDGEPPVEHLEAPAPEAVLAASTTRPGFAPLVFSSALFAMMHPGWDKVPLFVFAACLGYAFRQTGRIGPSLVAHVCLNGWTMLMAWIMHFAGAPK